MKPLQLFPLVLHWIVGLVLAQSQSKSLVISTTSGSFRGVSVPSNGTEKWLGIPFALPPVGPLRFKAPVPFKPDSSSDSTVKTAETFGNACPQTPGTLGAPISEDCLFLNVWRPQNTPSNAKLPVLVWIYVTFTFSWCLIAPFLSDTLREVNILLGKSLSDFRRPIYKTKNFFDLSAASVPMYDPTRIFQRAGLNGKPIIFVSMNYRINTFGFLASSLMEPQDLCAGLLDQRLALEWVQDNIEAFGGDKEKVTIWGQSAGAGSTEAHLIYHTNRTLFRGAMGDSAVGPFKSSPPASTYDRPGLPFARLLQNTGCTAGPEALDCLRSIPFETLLGISNSMIDATLNMQLWQPAIGPPGSFADTRASIKIQNKDFLHIPYFGGTNLNEGTRFSVSVLGLELTGQAQDEAFINFIEHLVIDNSSLTSDVLDDILRMWPADDPTLGGPFHTGDALFDRASAWYGDEMFIAPRRLLFENAEGLQDIFAYWFQEFVPGENVTLGVAHASELQLLFGPVPVTVEDEFANQMLDFYINFINDLDPGGEL
ncbi:hypothetical protein D9757_014160 [Collybiopsis confluens]|uniref:Carboxylic ester hydrolase n=1 Tax=Collybiopsis confluens TaxID=2823264 RepID=A0A8H5CMF3_9AGAR|nr:hypothetical protein D9757_014160 [Collybiopsis confluens]